MAPSAAKKAVKLKAVKLSQSKKRPVELVDEVAEVQVTTKFKKFRNKVQISAPSGICRRCWSAEGKVCDKITEDERKLVDIKEVERLLSYGMLDVNSLWNNNVHFGSGAPLTTPLVEAAYFGHKDLAKLLLDRGADPNKRNSNGSTPLHFAASCDHTELVRLLLDRGAMPSPTNGSGETPLHFAAWHGNREVVRLLLDRGALPNTATVNGKTPLQWAEIWKNKDVVQILLENGADRTHLPPPSIKFQARSEIDVFKTNPYLQLYRDWLRGGP